MSIPIFVVSQTTVNFPTSNTAYPCTLCSNMIIMRTILYRWGFHLSATQTSPIQTPFLWTDRSQFLFWRWRDPRRHLTPGSTLDRTRRAGISRWKFTGKENTSFPTENIGFRYKFLVSAPSHVFFIFLPGVWNWLFQMGTIIGERLWMNLLVTSSRSFY